jgi:hypothetical protein
MLGSYNFVWSKYRRASGVEPRGPSISLLLELTMKDMSLNSTKLHWKTSGFFVREEDVEIPNMAGVT